MLRFRPNLVDGSDAYAEDSWKRILGALGFV
jgi:uncharacterized protein YcbX